jgi:flagellar biosynthesis protein FlhG
MPEETHYDVLDVPRGAPHEVVEAAYREGRALYDEHGVATYSLLDSEERKAARARLDEAYRVLSDPILRSAYDRELGLPPPPPRPSPADYEIAARARMVVLPDPVTGADLRKFREARGVTLARIAADSKVGTRTFEDIEADRYDRLPAPVYVRGFIQEYARAVGLDPKKTAESFLARLPRR